MEQQRAAGLEVVALGGQNLKKTVTSNTPEVSESYTKAYLMPLPEVRSFLAITVPASGAG